MRFRKYLPYAAIIVLCVTIDQWIKMLVETRLVMHELVNLLPFFSLFRTYNTGVAFSMFSWIDDKGLVAISVVVIAFMLYLAANAKSWFALTGFALVIGGAIGNVIDRAVYGHVIDYYYFHTPVWSFAVFNQADVFITVGAGMILLYELFGARSSD